MVNLWDREAVEAVAARIDWKYALGLELTDSSFDSSVLTLFRSRLLKRGKEKLELFLSVGAPRSGSLRDNHSGFC